MASSVVLSIVAIIVMARLALPSVVGSYVIVLALWWKPTAAMAARWLSASSVVVALVGARHLMRTDLSAERAVAA